MRAEFVAPVGRVLSFVLMLPAVAMLSACGSAQQTVDHAHSAVRQVIKRDELPLPVDVKRSYVLAWSKKARSENKVYEFGAGLRVQARTRCESVMMSAAQLTVAQRKLEADGGFGEQLSKITEESPVIAMASDDPDDHYVQQCALDRIHAEKPWMPKLKANTVKVAIVDTGVGPHDDLPNVEGDQDVNGHGTHIAGIVAAIGDNNRGVVGLMWNRLMLYSYRFLDENGRGRVADAVEQIDKAVSKGADIVVLPWGVVGEQPCLREVLEDNSGVLFVVPAGNSGIAYAAGTLPEHLMYPAAYNDLGNVISVGATNCLDQWTWFSNCGEHVDIVAPGDGLSPRSRIVSTVLNDKYGHLAGTSMAAAYVAGTAALIKNQEGLSAQQIRKRLAEGATKVASDGRCPATTLLRLDEALP